MQRATDIIHRYGRSTLNVLLQLSIAYTLITKLPSALWWPVVSEIFVPKLHKYDYPSSSSLLLHGLNARWCPRHISRDGSISSCPSPMGTNHTSSIVLLKNMAGNTAEVTWCYVLSVVPVTSKLQSSCCSCQRQLPKPADLSPLRCSWCEKLLCEHCLCQCTVCCLTFCHLCSITKYACSFILVFVAISSAVKYCSSFFNFYSLLCLYWEMFTVNLFWMIFVF